MPSATLTSKGQITIPKEMREDLNLETGSKIMFVRLPNGHYSVVPKTGKISDIFGMLHYPGMPTMSLEEMDEAIAKSVFEADQRTRSA